MKVADAMSREVCTASPDQTICEAACLMSQIDAGSIPVAENDRLVGMITDRDIAIRAVGSSKGPDTPIREVMTPEVKYCYEDEDLKHVADNMGELRLRRLPVMNREKRLVGILSIGDISHTKVKRVTAEALSHITERGGPHTQSAAP